MTTLKELMGDLTRGDGRKFTNKIFGTNEWMEPIFKDCYGNWHCLFSNGEAWVEACLSQQTWIEWTFSKKRIKLYQPIFRDKNLYGNYFSANHFIEEKNKKHAVFSHDVVGWIEVEAEVIDITPEEAK